MLDHRNRWTQNENAGFETVLWDSGSCHHYDSTAHAEYMQFPKKEEQMSVITLGGEEKEMDGIIYQCKIRDKAGRMFSA